MAGREAIELQWLDEDEDPRALQLGYADGDAYRKYESGQRSVPPMLALFVEAIDEGGWPAELYARRGVSPPGGSKV